MKDTPAGWPRIASAVFYEDARAAIDFLRDAFGFEVQLLVEGEGGRVEHSQLVYGGGLVMVASSGAGPHRPDETHRASPRGVGGANTQSMMVFVDSADDHCAQARSAGAVIVTEPRTTDYGEDYWADRNYEAVDPEGHHWWFTERVR